MTHLGYIYNCNETHSFFLPEGSAAHVHVQLTQLTAIVSAIKQLQATNYNILQARLVTVLHGRPESIMLQNLSIMLLAFPKFQFCLLCSFLCFPNINYADNFCR